MIDETIIVVIEDSGETEVEPEVYYDEPMDGEEVDYDYTNGYVDDYDYDYY